MWERLQPVLDNKDIYLSNIELDAAKRELLMELDHSLSRFVQYNPHSKYKDIEDIILEEYKLIFRTYFFYLLNVQGAILLS